MTTTTMRLFTTLTVFSTALFIGCSEKSSTPAAPTASAPEKIDAPAFALVRDLAGSATSDDASTSLSFNVPVPTLTEEENARHVAGDVLFGRKFNADSGLGPAFNANSCTACHKLDGRGALPMIPPGADRIRFGQDESLLLRVGLETDEGPKLVPGFTEQLFHRGIYALRPDSVGTGQADIDMSYVTTTFTYPDGHKVELHKPVFTLSNAYDAAPGKPSALDDPRVRISPRMGPPMIGLGLLNAIDERDILALADPDDKDGDGISGRPNMIDGKLGRFGWKANNIDIRHQVAGALSNDMGLRSSLFPKENISETNLFTSLIERLASLWKPLDTEISDESLDLLEFYTSTVSVPQRRDVENPAVLRGARSFENIGCTSCHTPHFKTTDAAIAPSLRGLDIYPFSDGLLHDMGEELADGRPDHEATGNEWKTRPLWGVGMTQVVNPRAGFLHDGRARTLEEAILHHGGEGAASRTRFAKLTDVERQEVVSFLRSL